MDMSPSSGWSHFIAFLLKGSIWSDTYILVLHPLHQHHFSPLSEDSWMWITHAENTLPKTQFFFTSLTVFQFCTLDGPYRGTAQALTPTQAKQPGDKSRIALFNQWWLSGCLCCIERLGWRRARGCGQSSPFLYGVTTLEDIGACQIFIPAEASHGSSITLSLWPQPPHHITLTNWTSSIFKSI